MVSIQSSSYGVSALVSSLTPAATKNGEPDPARAKTSDNDGTVPAAGATSASGPRPGSPLRDTGETADSTDGNGTALTLLETDEPMDFRGSREVSYDDFEAAAQFLLESIDLRETDDAPRNFGSHDSGIRFEDDGTYRPAWI